MSVDRNYTIRIATVADNTGAKAAVADLSKVSQTVNESGEESQKAGEKVEGHAKHIAGLHKMCHALNEVVPGLGAVMQAAFSPIGATITVAVMALRFFTEKIKEANEEMKRMEEEAAKPLSNRTEALRDQTVRLAVGMAELKDRLNKARDGQQDLKTKVEETSAAFKVQEEITKNRADALKDNQLARLDEQHKAGLLGEQDYATKRLEIEVEFIRRKRQLEETAEMTEILLRKRLLAQAEMNATDPVKAEEKKEKALTDLHSLRSKTAIEEDKKTADQALKAWEEKNKPLADDFKQLGTGLTGAQVRAEMQKKYASEDDFSHTVEGYGQWQQLMAAQAGAQRQYDQAPAAEAKAQVAADNASREAEKAAKDYEAIAEQRRDIERREAEYNTRKQGNRDIDRLSADTAAVHAGVNPLKDSGWLGIVSRGSEALAANKPDRELAQYLSAVHENNTRTVNAIKAAQGNLTLLLPIVTKLEAEAAQHKREIELLKSREPNSFNHGN